MHEIACPTTGMTAMQSTDAKFQTLASDYEVGFTAEYLCGVLCLYVFAT